MGRVVRSGLTLLGLVAALGWSVLFVRAPGLAMEQLVLWSPVVVTLWLIVMLSASNRRATARRNTTGASAVPPPVDVRDAVLARDGGRCSLCGAPGAHSVAARRPVRRGDSDPLDRYVSLCDGCAAAGVLAPRSPLRGSVGS